MLFDNHLLIYMFEDWNSIVRDVERLLRLFGGRNADQSARAGDGWAIWSLCLARPLGFSYDK